MRLTQKTGGSAFEAEGLISAKALRQDCAWRVRGAAKRPSKRKQVRGTSKEAEAEDERELQAIRAER